MKNDELEAPLVSSWASPDKKIDGKGIERLSINKGYLDKESEFLKKTRVGGRQNKGNLETDETNTVEKS